MLRKSESFYQNVDLLFFRICLALVKTLERNINGFYKNVMGEKRFIYYGIFTVLVVLNDIHFIKLDKINV